MSSQDWMRFDHQPQPKADTTYPEETIWMLRKDGRAATAVVRRLPFGKELRFLVDGKLYESALHAVDRDPAILKRADEKRLEFLALGWTDAT